MPDELRTHFPKPDQQQQLREEIIKKRFDPGGFRRRKTDSTKTPDLKVLAALNDSTQSSIVFEFDGNRRLSIRRPGVKTSPETLHPRTWSEQVISFRKWLDLRVPLCRSNGKLLIQQDRAPIRPWINPCRQERSLTADASRIVSSRLAESSLKLLLFRSVRSSIVAYCRTPSGIAAIALVLPKSTKSALKTHR